MMCVQYIGGCLLHRGRFCTSRGYHDEYIRGYHEYIGGCSVHQGGTMSTSGNIMSMSVDVQYIGVFNKNQKSFMNLLST